MLARDTVPRLDQIREGFVDAAWRGLFWIAWVALPVNIWRTWQIGWTASFTILLIAVAAVFVIHARRKHLSLGIKGGLMLFILWFVSLAGVSSFGIAGPSITLLTTNGFVAAMIRDGAGARAAHGRESGVMFVDLDGFKAVNDGFGHEAGDHVLAQVATRLRACVRASDTAARIGGDEFMVVLVGLSDAEAAGQIADKIVEAVAQPIAFDSTTLTVGASVGIALFPDHAQDTNTLRRVADQAMYRVKRAGKNAYAFGEAALQA